MTNQELIDFVESAVTSQGGPSVVGGACAYRGTDGRKCAAGHLIADAHYTADLEGVVLCAEAVEPLKWKALRRALLLSGVRGDQLALVTEMQLAHDEAAFAPATFQANFARRVARIRQRWP